MTPCALMPDGSGPAPPTVHCTSKPSAARAALDFDVQCTVGWAEPAPSDMSAHVVLQPIVVVDGLKAL